MFNGFWQSKLFTLLALVMIFFLAAALLRMQPQKVVVEKKIKNFQDKIFELEKSNADLARLLDYFKSDAYLEREAKLKLNVRRPEEQVVFLHANDLRPANSSASEQNLSDGKWPYFNKLVQWVKNLF